jgi:integrase
VASLLEWAVNSGLAHHNVLAGYRRPPKSKAQKVEEAAKRRALSDTDIVKVWHAADTCGSFGALIRLGLLTGMRRNELANLRWDDVTADRIVLSAAMTKTAPLTCLAF